MSNGFNLNTFLNEYKSYNNRQYTAAENGKAAMEQREQQRANEAVNNTNHLLSLTLGEKLAELGIGEHVVQQIGDTALNMLKGVVSPINDYLEKYENIFDQDKFIATIQSDAKQMYFAREALAKDASDRIPEGQKFVYDM